MTAAERSIGIIPIAICFGGAYLVWLVGRCRERAQRNRRRREAAMRRARARQGSPR